ncbi:hypothetical protein EWM64_g6347 [Hericium alpestre]|uniref:Carbohydrate-binding module family 13 protein n=1 Tax=Hericium alpestre TaxID=135208 RepID=A0A4Y9ZSX0_9AGAM|nr:hypothetical protein EWM64_g6347 [Hericium alpestre]
MFVKAFGSALSLSVVAVVAQTYSATYTPGNAPDQTQQGQVGTNKCGDGSNQKSKCQNAYLNSLEDWCVFAPPEAGADSVIGNTERIEVAWCMKPGYGTRVIPDGTVLGAHFVQTPDYVQITGTGDLTKINVPAGDQGGELDPHGADGNGNPIGGLLFSSAFGQMEQLHEWTNFVSEKEFCFRGCKDGPNAPALCQHIYDTMGCDWNMPGNYAGGSFDQCKGDSGEPMGVYGQSTFHQGEPATPAAHPAPATSGCVTKTAIGNGMSVSGAVQTSTPAPTSTSKTDSSRTSGPSSGTAKPTTATDANSAPGMNAPGFGAVLALFSFGLLAF